MTFADGRMPASTDLVELSPVDGTAFCLACGEPLGRPRLLSEAIKLWTDHQDAKRENQSCSRRDAHGPHDHCPGILAHPLTMIGRQR